MYLFEKYIHSKWTSLKKINGWKHYEVKNVYVEKKECELFSVCDKNILVIVSIDEINNSKKWSPGWK